MIEYDGVSVTYRGAGDGVVALDDISLRLADGEMVAVLGANGSGKSTLARLANGLLRPGSGVVRVDGVDTRDDERSFDVRSKVGLVLQDPDNQIVATSVEEEVAFGPENLGLPPDELRDRVTEALAAVGLPGFETREPHALSGGQKQRLAIAGALAMRPAHLVLDEPTSMLDPVGRRDLLALVRRLRDEGVAVFLITHRVEEAAAADRIVVLDGGRVAFSGSWEELTSDVPRIARLGLGIPPLLELAELLRARGLAVAPSGTTPDLLVEALCR